MEQLPQKNKRCSEGLPASGSRKRRVWGSHEMQSDHKVSPVGLSCAYLHQRTRGNLTKQIKIKSQATESLCYRESLADSIKGKNTADKNLTEIYFLERLRVQLPKIFLANQITKFRRDKSC